MYAHPSICWSQYTTSILGPSQYLVRSGLCLISKFDMETSLELEREVENVFLSGYFGYLSRLTTYTLELEKRIENCVL